MKAGSYYSLNSNINERSRPIVVPCKFGVSILLGLFMSAPAMAYIDPISGAMLLQLLFSGVAGVVLVFRRVIGNFFRRIKERLKPGAHD